MSDNINKKRLDTTASNIQEAWRHLSDSKIIHLSDIRKALRHIQQASCSLQAIECSLSGVPEPREGE